MHCSRGRQAVFSLRAYRRAHDPTPRYAALLGVAALAATAAPATATPQAKGVPAPRPCASRPSTPRSTAPPRASSSTTSRHPTTSRPATSPRRSSARTRTWCSSTSSTTRRSRRALPRQLPRGRPARCGPHRVPVPLHRPEQHGRAERPRPQRRRPGRRGRRRVRLRALPGAVRHGRLQQVPDRPRPRADLPGVPLGRHAGQPHPHGLLLAGRAGRPAAELQEPLGPADRDRPQGRALPREPPDAAHLRRSRGPQRSAQRGRDPLLGRLRHGWADRRVHPRRRRGPGRLRATRASSSPATRTPTRTTATARTAPSTSPRQPRVNTSHTPTSGGGVEASETQGGINAEHVATRPRTRPTSPSRRATSGWTTCCRAATCRSATPGSSGPRATARCTA